MGNNPIKYTDPDGRVSWSTKMGWLPGVDGPFPIGDIIYGIGVTIELIGLIYSIEENCTSTVQTDAIAKTSNKNDPNILYRAVDKYELESIIANKGQFTMGYGSTYESGKLFQTELSDTVEYASLANKSIAKNNPYVAIVSTVDTLNLGVHVNSIIDAPSAVIVMANNLCTLSPATVLPMEL